MTGPYGTAAAVYWQAGWRGILPLPAKAKKNPPKGYTGDGGAYPSYADIHAWSEGSEQGGNIALRMPANVIGLDVDAYGDKPGAETLQLAESTHGVLPATWRTTSRDDGVSGIRLYRVPEGLAWPGEIGGATEIIQARHRYAVVWPSIHPEGRTYRWISPDGLISTRVPDPDDLPLLPESWVAAYTTGQMATTTARVSVSHSNAVAWVVAHDHATATMCDRMERALDQFADDLKGSAHNSTRDAVLRVARLADEGHHGAALALAEVRKGFITDATNPNRSLLGKTRRTESEAVHEFGDLVASGVGVVIANPTGMKTCDCFGQLTGMLLAPVVELHTDGAVALDPVPAAAPLPVEEASAEGLESRFKDGAAFILDAPDQLPNVWGQGDDCLWAEGEALMICGPPGVGKTTITGQLVRGLLGLQGSVLGLPVRQASKKVLYLAMDRPAQIARGLRRAFTESDRATLSEELRFWEGPPPGDVARHPTVLLSLAQLAEADVIIIDSLKDAAVGLSEDEVAAAYNRARQHCLANDVQVLELHHMVKRGANGAKPKELADVYGSAWLTAGAGSVVLIWGAAGDPIVEMMHLKQPAGEVGPWRLEHDHNRGTTKVFGDVDLMSVVAGGGYAGVTARDVAKLLFDCDDPSDNDRKKAIRKLDKLVESGLVERYETARDVYRGGKPQAYFRLANVNGHGNGHGSSEKFGRDNGQSTDTNGVSAGQANGQPTDSNGRQVQRTTPPPLQRGGVGPGSKHDEEEPPAPAPITVLEVACTKCFRPVPEVIAKTWGGLCGNCAREAGLT